MNWHKQRLVSIVENSGHSFFSIFRAANIVRLHCLVAIATSKADLIRAEQNHRSALDHVQDSEMNLRMQLEQGEATSRSLQSTLAVLVTEKEKLQVELNDLSTFCNELLSEMEGNKQQQQQQLSK